MMTSSSPVLRDLVLVGGEHSHALLLRMLGMKPEPGLRVTLVCPDTHTPYSGMLPGYVAGHYSFDECHIDLSRLATFAGARLIRSRAVGLHRERQQVMLPDRPPLDYDLLSINIGATPQRLAEGAQALAIPVKPISEFNQRWLALLEKVRQSRQRLTIAVVGGGAAGVEMVLSMQYRLRLELRALGRNPENLRFVLISANADVMPTHPPRVRAHMLSVLRERNVEVHLNAEVQQVQPGCVVTSSGRTLDADEVLWVTQAGGPAWLHGTGLALDERGFIQVNQHLQSVSDPRVFAAGDIASFVPRPLEKAGVFAVRMAPLLHENLRRQLHGRPLRVWRPQRHWLALVSTGNRHAVASRGNWSFWGDWIWSWKDRIDRRFMHRLGDGLPLARMAQAGSAAAQPALTQALAPEERQQALSALAMRCGGCGAKLGPDILARALQSLQPVRRPDVRLGLSAGDDAAVLQVPPGQLLVHSVDFFRALIDDPYLLGQIAAVHALGDIWAMGAEPQSASAIVTIPPGLDRKVQGLLEQLMAGALQVLNAEHCALVGGHSAEGLELAIGFAVNGLLADHPKAAMRKDSLKPGDLLILTKALGTGTLLAAHAQARARGRWVDAALLRMRQSSAQASAVFRAHQVLACTDVTGFGLLGHVLEMTRASGVDVHLDLAALPVLDGALETLRLGITSSLHAANERLAGALANASDHADDLRVRLLADPQTAGGLLAGVAPAQAEACLAALHAAGYADAAIIGQVHPAGPQAEPIRLVKGLGPQR